MDAFAVSICKGLSVRKVQLSHALICGAWFGGFQGLMPALGFFLGSLFAQAIERFDHWVAFILLALIGANMLREAFSKGEEESTGSVIHIAANGASKGEQNPNTGAPAMSMAPAMLVLAAAVLVLKKRG